MIPVSAASAGRLKSVLLGLLAAGAALVTWMIVTLVRSNPPAGVAAAGVGVRVMWLLVFGVLAIVLRRLPWGQDVTRWGDTWVPTSQVSERVGEPEDGTRGVVESREAHGAVRFWCSIFGLLALVTLPGAASNYANEPLASGSAFIGACVLLVFLAHLALSTFSRIVRSDAKGISDATFFQVRRVPYTAMATLRRINQQAEAQRSYDTAFRAGRSGRGFRPKDLWAWQVLDARDAVVLDFGETMVPTDAFDALRARIAKFVLVTDHSKEAVYVPEDDELDLDSDRSA